MSAFQGVFSIGEVSVTFAEAVEECWNRRMKMGEQGWYVSPHTSYNMADGQGEPM